MNSSTSSSEREAMSVTGMSVTDGQTRRWRSFSIILLLAIALGFPAVVGALYLIDPYGSGRVTLIDPPGVRAQGVRTAHASRGRDPAYNAAIIGNSRTQLLMPARLSELTGAAFVSLSVPGSGPREQLTVLDWFLRHRPVPAKAVVIGTDPYWCRPEPDMKPWNPFPFWLYTADALEYIGGLARFSALEEGLRRLQYVMGARDQAVPDGYWDYEPNYIAQGFELPEKRAILAQHKTVGIVNESGRFPAIEALSAALARIPQQTAVILFIPPLYETGRPEAEGAEGRTEAACRAALTAAAQTRANTAVLEWGDERPQNSQNELFFDHVHYRAPIARAAEDDIAALLRNMTSRTQGR